MTHVKFPEALDFIHTCQSFKKMIQYNVVLERYLSIMRSFRAFITLYRPERLRRVSHRLQNPDAE
jgi:hypothetical protein